MSKSYLPYDPDQQLLLPAALREWLPPDLLAYFISEKVFKKGLGNSRQCSRAGYRLGA